MAKRHQADISVVGWREWIALPELGIATIKAKVDTGARSSSLHVIHTETFRRRGVEWIRFDVHPIQRNTREIVHCEARVLEYRRVRSSSGEASLRPVITTEVALLGSRWPIELTLANRDAMGFRMLLGREAIRHRFLVDPGQSYYGGRPERRRKKKRGGR